MSKRTISIGRVILQLALGLMLVVGGIWALFGSGDAGASAIKTFFKGDVAKILVIVYALIEIISGFFLVLDLILGDRLGTLGTVLMIILIIVWIGVIILSDILGVSFRNTDAILNWIYRLSQHLIVLGAMIFLRF